MYKEFICIAKVEFEGEVLQMNKILLNIDFMLIRFPHTNAETY
jgi:hypothetical protein